MAIVTLTADTWSTVTTTTTATAITNTGGRVIYLAVEDTTELPGDGGVPLNPGDTLVVESGNDVEGYSHGSAGRCNVVEIGTPA